MTRILFTTLLALLLGVSTSLAQQRRPAPAPAKATVKPAMKSASKLRGYVSVDGGYQGGTEDFGNGGTFTQYLEEARFDSDYELKPGPQLNIAGGIGIWKNVYAGVAVTRFTRTTPTRVTGAIPHPFFFSRLRNIEGDVAGLKREELAVHLHARVVVPTSPKMTVALFGGPSWFSVKQGVVGGIQYTESYPFDTAAFQSATTSRSTKSQVGFNVGGDVAYFFMKNVGIGGSAQFARAEVTLPSGNANDVTMDVGGLQGGVGLRLRF
jgi:hypothetical protein